MKEGTRALWPLRVVLGPPRRGEERRSLRGACCLGEQGWEPEGHGETESREERRRKYVVAGGSDGSDGNEGIKELHGRKKRCSSGPWSGRGRNRREQAGEDVSSVWWRFCVIDGDNENVDVRTDNNNNKNRTTDKEAEEEEKEGQEKRKEKKRRKRWWRTRWRRRRRNGQTRRRGGPMIETAVRGGGTSVKEHAEEETEGRL